MPYRHEWKFEINRLDLLTLRMRLSAVMSPDPHAVDGVYHIRSLYFDTAADKALREKLDGLNRREKFRLRLYNGSTDLIKLEKKSKCNGLSSKESTVLNEEEVKKLLSGDTDWMLSSPSPLLRELYTKMRSEGLRPRSIVEYTREAFVFPAGNVRVTLDTDIRTDLGGLDFLDPAALTVPAGDSPLLLEVKWDEFLPDIIRDVVSLPSRRTGAFSKYAACRIYG